MFHGQVGSYSQGVGWGSVDGKLLRGSVNPEGIFSLNQADRILAEGRPRGSDITRRAVVNEETS